MNSNQDLALLFFRELKTYNSSNFKILQKLDIKSVDDPVVYKSFSSVITRYFIFHEKHPEISELDMKLLYFKLSIDMIARFFSQYPAGNIEDLLGFQRQLNVYAEEMHNYDDRLKEVV